MTLVSTGARNLPAISAMSQRILPEYERSAQANGQLAPRTGIVQCGLDGAHNLVSVRSKSTGFHTSEFGNSMTNAERISTT